MEPKARQLSGPRTNGSENLVRAETSPGWEWHRDDRGDDSMPQGSRLRAGARLLETSDPFSHPCPNSLGKERFYPGFESRRPDQKHIQPREEQRAHCNS